jgi:hypothetical protein
MIRDLVLYLLRSDHTNFLSNSNLKVNRFYPGKAATPRKVISSFFVPISVSWLNCETPSLMRWRL